jgi:hypothetical protein
LLGDLFYDVDQLSRHGQHAELLQQALPVVQTPGLNDFSIGKAVNDN